MKITVPIKKKAFFLVAEFIKGVDLMFGMSEKKIKRWASKGNVGKLEKVINNNAEFREVAFKALGESGDHDSVTLLTNFVRHPDAEFRKLTAKAMGESGAERTIEFLRKLTKDDTDEEVREIARESIIKIHEVMRQV